MVAEWSLNIVEKNLAKKRKKEKKENFCIDCRNIVMFTFMSLSLTLMMTEVGQKNGQNLVLPGLNIEDHLTVTIK